LLYKVLTEPLRLPFLRLAKVNLNSSNNIPTIYQNLKNEETGKMDLYKCQGGSKQGQEPIEE
jgi:hypothetical protein